MAPGEQDPRSNEDLMRDTTDAKPAEADTEHGRAVRELIEKNKRVDALLMAKQATDGGDNPHYEPMLQFFAFAHLPAPLQDVSRAFYELAGGIVADVPRNPERTVALRKLLEAKDCAVRAVLYR